MRADKIIRKGSLQGSNTAEVVELNEILTGALDAMDSAFIIIKEGVCVFENTGFRRILGVDEDFTLLEKSDADLFNVVFGLRKSISKEIDVKTRLKIKAMVEKKHT